jgi:integrase
MMVPGAGTNDDASLPAGARAFKLNSGASRGAGGAAHGGLPPALPLPVEVRPWLRSFRAWALTQGGWAPATSEVQVRQLLFLAEHFRLPLDESFSFEAGEEVLAERRMAGASVWAYNTDVKALNKVMEWPRVGAGDSRRYRKLPVPPGEFKALGEGQVRALLAYQHRDPIVHRFRRALLQFTLYAGLRNSEVAAMDRGDVSWEPHPSYGVPWFSVLHPAKRGRVRDLPLTGWMTQRTRPFRACLEWRDALGLEGPLGKALWLVAEFNRKPGAAVLWRRPGKDYLRKVLNTVGHEVLGEPFSFTVARHTVLLDMVERGEPLPHASYWAGHKDERTIMIYTKVRAAHVFEAVKRRPKSDPYKGMVMEE